MSENPERRSSMSLAVAAGLLLAASFPPVPTGVFAFVALVPFLFLMDRMKSAAQVFRYSYLTFLVFNIGTIYWISGWWGDDIWLKASGIAVNLVHPLWFTIPSLFYYFVRRRLGMMIGVFSFPFVWTAYEWLAHLPELSFPWLVLANTQTYDIDSIQFITITGTFGLTFLIVAFNAGLFIILRQLLKRAWSLRGWQFRTTVLLLLMAIILPRVHSAIVMDTVQSTYPKIRVGIVQPNIDPYEKWATSETPSDKLENLLVLYDSLASGEQPDLILMPETAIPFRILQPLYHDEWQYLKSHVDSVGIPLLSGVPDLLWYASGLAPAGSKKIPDSDQRYDNFNSALLVAPGNPATQIYHKSRLTPMSERTPYIESLPFLAELLTWGVGISSWGLGNDTTVFDLGTQNGDVKVWPMICYETLYPEFVAGFVRRGANLLLVITNDGWFGKSSGPVQLMRYTVLRAVENRRAVARCANNGISCFIDPWGRVTQTTDLYSRGTIAASLPLGTRMTFYTQYGDWFPIGTVVIAGLLMLFSIIVPSYKRNRAQKNRRT